MDCCEWWDIEEEDEEAYYYVRTLLKDFISIVTHYAIN